MFCLRLSYASGIIVKTSDGQYLNNHPVYIQHYGKFATNEEGILNVRAQVDTKTLFVSDTLESPNKYIIFVPGTSDRQYGCRLYVLSKKDFEKDVTITLPKVNETGTWPMRLIRADISPENVTVWIDQLSSYIAISSFSESVRIPPQYKVVTIIFLKEDYDFSTKTINLPRGKGMPEINIGSITLKKLIKFEVRKVTVSNSRMNINDNVRKDSYYVVNPTNGRYYFVYAITDLTTATTFWGIVDLQTDVTSIEVSHDQALINNTQDISSSDLPMHIPRIQIEDNIIYSKTRVTEEPKYDTGERNYNGLLRPLLYFGCFCLFCLLVWIFVLRKKWPF